MKTGVLEEPVGLAVGLGVEVVRLAADEGSIAVAGNLLAWIDVKEGEELVLGDGGDRFSGLDCFQGLAFLAL